MLRQTILGTSINNWKSPVIDGRGHVQWTYCYSMYHPQCT